MSLSVFSKAAHLVRDHPIGTGNGLATMTLTNTTASFAGFINANYAALHLGLSILVGSAAIISYGVGAYIRLHDHFEKKREKD